MRDGLDPRLGFPQRVLGALVGHVTHLQRHEAGHQLQRIADAVVHLPQHGLGPVARQSDFLLRPVVVALQTTAHDRILQRRAQQGGEVLRHILDHIVRRPGPQGRHRQAAFLRARHIDNRRRGVQRHDLRQHVHAVTGGHIMIQRADVVFELLEQAQTFVSVGGAGDHISFTAQFLLDQPGQAPVVVDVEQADGAGVFAHSISGAWITDRNRPNWRIAPAKDS